MREREVLAVRALDPELVDARLHRRRGPEARVRDSLGVDRHVDPVLERAAERGSRDLPARLRTAEDRDPALPWRVGDLAERADPVVAAGHLAAHLERHLLARDLERDVERDAERLVVADLPAELDALQE